MSDAMKVYAFCNSGSGTDFQMWMAIAETGQVITQHCSSSRQWGIHDVGPEWKQEAYERALGEGFEVEYIVVDDREGPPAEVVEANRLLGAKASTEKQGATK